MSENKIEELFTHAMKTMDHGMQCMHAAIEVAARSESNAVELLAETARDKLAGALELLAEAGIPGDALDAVCTALEPLCDVLEGGHEAVREERAKRAAVRASFDALVERCGIDLEGAVNIDMLLDALDNALKATGI